MTNTAIGYERVSTTGQVDGEGLGVQRDKIVAWCRYQAIELRVIEQDAGLSGASTDNRPGLKRALKAALDLGPSGVLVVGRLDRLGRNAIDVQETLAVLLDSKVRIVSLGDGVDSESGMGSAILKLLTTVLATFAEMEKDFIRARLLDGRRRADRENRVYASEPRYGRRVGDDGRTLVPDANETAVVEKVRALRADGNSYRAICEALHDAGLRPRRAGEWSPTVVRRIATGLRAPRKTRPISLPLSSRGWSASMPEPCWRLYLRRSSAASSTAARRPSNRG